MLINYFELNNTKTFQKGPSNKSFKVPFIWEQTNMEFVWTSFRQPQFNKNKEVCPPYFINNHSRIHNHHT